VEALNNRVLLSLGCIFALRDALNFFCGFWIEIMPKATYGPKVKNRTIHVLRALLQYANSEIDATYNNRICYSWQTTDTQGLKLVIQTTLRAIQEICQEASPPQRLTTFQIREALYNLDKFVGILDDHRVHQRGSEIWIFTLLVPSKGTEHVISEVGKQWDRLREQRIELNNSVNTNLGQAENSGKMFLEKDLLNTRNDKTDIALDEIVSDLREKIRPRIQQKCSTMRVLDMTHPIEISGENGIYTNVNILERISAKQRIELSTLIQSALLHRPDGLESEQPVKE
jgi:hypothetical protein